MNTENTAKKAFNWDILSSIFIYAWAGIFFVSSLSIKNPGSRMFPQIICSLAILLSTIFLISTIRHMRKTKEGEEKPSFAGSGRAAIMCAFLILYILANYLTGFYISTLLYLPAAMLYLGQRNWKAVIGVTVGLPLIVYVFFDLLLKMQMPTALLF
ncbi:MAG: tripartite tricarboxylate transporter TctB family protein [Clostridiales bacterium]